MKKRILKYIWYILLAIWTIGGIALIFEKKPVILIIVIILWAITLTIDITKEKNKQFKDWELENYGYNATSNKEHKNHYNEYKKQKNKKDIKK